MRRSSVTAAVAASAMLLCAVPEARGAAPLLSTSTFSALPTLSTDTSKIQVLTSFMERSTHKLIIESRKPLVSGRMVYVGPSAVPFTLAEIVSRSEIDYFYLATAQGGQPVKEGDLVSLDKPKSAELSIPAFVTMSIKQRYVFEAKLRGSVTAVMGDRAMIDKGSVQEVDKLDLYRIYDSSGHYKGLIELRGIGDFQSQGLVYHALEDRIRGMSPVAPGDTVIFAGQRKPLALGVLGALPAYRAGVEGDNGVANGGGLLLSFTWPDGWGVELVGGLFQHTAQGSADSHFTDNVNRVFITYQSHQDVKATYYAPVWIKKNFRYPSDFSPFLAAGLCYYKAQNNFSWYYSNVDQIGGTAANAFVTDSHTVRGVAPVLGGGFEFFPGKTIRPRAEVRYFGGQPIKGAGGTFNSEMWFYSFGVLMQW